MPSSISNSERRPAVPGLRLTASDRPGVAQPVPERDIPRRRWGVITGMAGVVFALLLGAWEWHWRADGNLPTYENSNGLWARERRRIDDGDGRRTVLVGDSRMLFDVDLDTWEHLSGERPIQLSMEGTSALFALEDLADDPNFKGRLLVGMSPQVFFLGFGFRADVFPYFHRESLSQRVGQWLAMHTIDRWFGFYNSDLALNNLLKRQSWWPARDGLRVFLDVRKLSVSDADRNTELWSKVETDEAYRNLAKHIWAQRFDPPDAKGQAGLDASIAKQIGRAAAVSAKLRERGIEMIFVRLPSADGYLDYERRDLPRSKTWDLLLAKTGVPGIYFADYPELNGFNIPEWSHLAASEKQRFTAGLYNVIAREDKSFFGANWNSTFRPSDTAK